MWWLLRTYGTDPVNVERLTDVQVGQYRCVFKPDCVRIGEKGEIILDDYKTGWVPGADIARRMVRHIFYALAARTYFKIPTVKTVLWNVTEEYSIVIEWTPEELDRFEPYVEKILEQRSEMIAKIEATPEDQRAALMETPQFEPRLNGYCNSCALRPNCEKFKALIMWGVFPQELTAFGRLEMVRESKRTIDKAEKALTDSVKADVLERGKRGKKVKSDGTEIPMIVLREGDYEAVVEINETKLNDTDQQALRMDLLDKGTKTEEKSKGKEMVQYTMDFGEGLKATLRKGKEKMTELLDGFNVKRRTRITRRLYVRKADDNG
jgi:hypothetical protein